MSYLVEKAKEHLGVTDSRETTLEYSGRFTAYNGRVQATRLLIAVKLSKEWKNRDDDVQMGIIEHMLAKLFRKKVKTARMELYRDFLLYVGRESTKTVQDDDLQQSYDRVNMKYFANQMELPSIKWGTESFRKLGHYHFASDTVVLSTVLLANKNMLDYVMYHELLHKKHGLTKGGRAHTKAFRDDEAKFAEANEAQLQAFIRQVKRNLF